MATEILPVATGVASSADIVVASGDEKTVFAKDSTEGRIAYNARLYVEIKDDAGLYFIVDEMTPDKQAIVLSAAGTYRVRRAGNGAAVGACLA